MAKINKLILSLILFFNYSSFLHSIEFEPEETATIQKCENNISQKIFSPKIAEECLANLHKNNDRLLDKLHGFNKNQAFYVLEYNNAIKDLGDFFSDNNFQGQNQLPKDLIAIKMHQKLEQKFCSLCELNLGPEPEKLLNWISKYASDKTQPYKEAVRTWDTLGNIITNSLETYGYSENSWKTYKILERPKILDRVANHECNKILQKYKKCSKQGNISDKECIEILKYGIDPQDHQKIKAMWEYLDEECINKINEFRENFKINIAKINPQTNKGTEVDSVMKSNIDKYSKLQKNLKGLSSKSESDQLAFLGTTFDKSQLGYQTPGVLPVPKPGTIPGIQPNYTLTDEQADLVAQKLRVNLLDPQGELSQTKIGDDIISFYSQKDKNGNFVNQLNLKVMDLGNADGAFCPPHFSKCTDPNKKITTEMLGGDLAISKPMIEKWMQSKKYTAEQLLNDKDPKAMKELTTYVAPIFVHEAIHQKQSVWAKKNNVPNHYQSEQEIESFSKEALFVAEKNENEKKKGNPNYYSQIKPGYLALVYELKENNVLGIRRIINYYPEHSLEAKSAENFRRYDSLIKELENRKAEEPSIERKKDSTRPHNDCTSTYYDIKDCTTASIQEQINTTYSWYKLVIAKRTEDEKFINNEINRIKAQKEKYKTLTTTKPPDL